MATQANTSERETIDKLLATLQELPDVRAEPKASDGLRLPNQSRVDAEFDLKIADKHYVLLVEAKKSVFPRDAREVLWTIQQIKNYAQAFGQDKNVVPLLAAESLSPGAKELLKHENVGYYDTGGSLFIPASGAYIYIEKPPPKIISKSIRAIFRGTRAQVLHALLHERDEWLSVRRLSEIAGVSPATASQTLTALERFDWLASRGKGPSKERRLAEPAALLDEWKKQVLAASQTRTRRLYVPGIQFDALISKLASVCEANRVEYALTQEAAAQIYAPFLSAISRVSCRLATGPQGNVVIHQLDARVVTEGANLLVLDSPSKAEFLFKERVGSAWLASPIQVYLDLLEAGGRSREMADHLRREKIGF
jgi:DNA-binding transcriptional ArsR family regulator